MEVSNQVACAYCGTLTARQGGYCCLACEHLADLRVPVSYSEKSYEYLDQEDFRALYRRGDFQIDVNAKGRVAVLPKKVAGFISQHYRLPKPNAPPVETYEFYVEGLHCTSCIHLLEKLPELYSEILSSRVHFGKSTLTVTLSADGSLAQTAALIKSLGYEPIPLAPDQPSQALRSRETQQDLLRLAVAGFCAGNMMLFVVPIYGGLSGKVAEYFNWIGFGFFLPVLLYSAVPFYKGAWASLKYRTMSVDLPITLAVFGGFVMSLVNLVRGNDAVYFDSTASFLFFILVARFFLKRTQQGLLSADQAKHYYKRQKYIRVEPSGVRTTISWKSVAVGDHLWVDHGQLVPSESTLLSTVAHMDMSMFSGESLPRSFSQGMTVFGGSKVLGPGIQIRVAKSFSESQIGKLFEQLEAAMTAKNRFATLSDKLAQGLILTVLVAAGIFFAIYAPIDPQEAFNRSLALIILACPCALAFGTPLAYALSMKQAQHKGILIRSSEVLDKMLEVKDIFFDKTGTLTTGELTLTKSVPAELPPETKSLILSLESVSHHPIAFSLRRAWPDAQLTSLLPSTLGPKGLSAEQDGYTYEIRELQASAPGEIAVEFLRNGQQLAQLYFSDPLRADTAVVVKRLFDLGLDGHLLSGDKIQNVQKVANALGITSVRGDLTSEEKRTIVSSVEKSCMIGDGANDALALNSAQVGIAVQGSVDLSLSSAAVTFTRAGLGPLLDLMDLARRNRRTLTRNLTVSFIYNFMGAVLALLGLINPMMAAILMPVSSMFIVLSTLMGVK